MSPESSRISTLATPATPGRPMRAASRPLNLLWLLGLTCVLRFPALVSHPFNIDESYYAAGAAELVSGGAFYRNVVDHKPPGIYFLYALIYRLAGTYNQTAVHVVLLLVAALTAYLVGLVAQEFFDGRAGLWAGTLYAVASVVGPANDFQAANTELFMNLPLVAALWLAARLWVRQRAPRVEALAMGLLVGVAILIRPQAALALLPIAVALYRRKVGFWTMAIVAAGALLPSLALLTWLWHADAIADLRTSLAYARYYTNSLPFEVKLANATLKTLFFVAIDVGLLIPVVMLVVQGRRRDIAWQQGAGCLLASWLLVSFVAVGMGGRFYPHYFIQVLPPLAVMAARQLTTWRREAA
jgi:4-amino-4-deoxy-L-arabinose transferase-like glycosyltransferase